jgi:hypothetical protein
MISDDLDTDPMQNTFLYVGDGVRYDYLVDDIANMGSIVRHNSTFRQIKRGAESTAK